MEEDVFKGRGARISPKNPFIKREEVAAFPEGIDEEKFSERPVTRAR